MGVFSNLSRRFRPRCLAVAAVLLVIPILIISMADRYRGVVTIYSMEQASQEFQQPPETLGRAVPENITDQDVKSFDFKGETTASLETKESSTRKIYDSDGAISSDSKAKAGLVASALVSKENTHDSAIVQAAHTTSSPQTSSSPSAHSSTKDPAEAISPFSSGEANNSATKKSLIVEPKSIVSDAAATSAPKAYGTPWPTDSFCHKFLVDTYSTPVPVCTDGSERVMCNKSPHYKMASCTIRNMALIPGNQLQDGNIWLQSDSNPNGLDSNCNQIQSTHFLSQLEKGDFVGGIINNMAHINRNSTKACDVTFKGTAFIHQGDAVHIYFKFLAWYNLYKLIEDNGGNASKVMRIGVDKTGKTSFLFGDVEKRIFPNAVQMVDMEKPKAVHCFEKVVLSPNAFMDVLFRCKMSTTLARQCYKCNGRDVGDTSFLRFRQKVLSACNLKDDDGIRKDNMSTPRQITVILRKPYLRYYKDKMDLHRILVNAEELIGKLNSSFPSATIVPAFMEQFSLCEQVRLAHTSDVLIGVHGAGLVHLWWLQDHALMFELIPRTQVGNPTFKMLSTITGRNYHGYLIRKSTGDMKINVDVNRVIKELTEVYKKIVTQSE